MHGRTRYGTDGKGIPLPNHTQHPPNQNNNTMDFLKNDFFLLTLTFGVFLAAKTLQKKTGSTLLNPILISIALLIGYLKLTDISYGEYNKSAHLIEFWLKPAVVALGVPLYRQLSTIRTQIVPLVVSSLVGCISGIVSVVIVARMCGASHDVAISLAPKSVTTPIAMEVSRSIGGIPSLTAAVVVVVGIFGAMLGFRILQVGHVHNPIAQGLSMGTASHAVGTSKAMEVGTHYGAFSSLGLTLNGIFTAIFTPLVLKLMGMI